jgi:plasmid maintenance system antidote protein VapI
MNGATFRKLIEAADITQTDIAETLEVGPRYVRKMIADEVPITKRAAFAVRWLHYCKVNGVDPETGKPQKV